MTTSIRLHFPKQADGKTARGHGWNYYITTCNRFRIIKFGQRGPWIILPDSTPNSKKADPSIETFNKWRQWLVDQGIGWNQKDTTIEPSYIHRREALAALQNSLEHAGLLDVPVPY